MKSRLKVREREVKENGRNLVLVTLKARGKIEHRNYCYQLHKIKEEMFTKYGEDWKFEKIRVHIIPDSRCSFQVDGIKKY